MVPVLNWAKKSLNYHCLWFPYANLMVDPASLKKKKNKTRLSQAIFVLIIEWSQIEFLAYPFFQLLKRWSYLMANNITKMLGMLQIYTKLSQLNTLS